MSEPHFHKKEYKALGDFTVPRDTMPRPNNAYSDNAYLDSLRLINDGHPPAYITKTLKEAKSSTYRRIKALKAKGLITKGAKIGWNEWLWKLTPAGKLALEMNRNLLGNAYSKLFRWHHLIFKMPLIRGSAGFTDDVLSRGGFVARKRGAINGFEVKVGNALVFFTGSSFLLFPRPFEAKDLEDCIEKGLKMADATKEELERRYPWVKIDGRAEVCRDQIAKRGGITKWLPPSFRFFGDRLLVDFSKGEPEIEAYKHHSAEGMMRVMSFLDRVAEGEFEPRDEPRLEVG